MAADCRVTDRRTPTKASLPEAKVPSTIILDTICTKRDKNTKGLSIGNRGGGNHRAHNTTGPATSTSSGGVPVWQVFAGVKLGE
ncbi:hypothetical protein M0R45_014117 [Rubus argutus]|uniref:Uncharacterized protein n=1 Tax=Rubus argutus TaxID=59490 RepID=A0AAW1XN04_RUBAR